MQPAQHHHAAPTLSLRSQRSRKIMLLIRRDDNVIMNLSRHQQRMRRRRWKWSAIDAAETLTHEQSGASRESGRQKFRTTLARRILYIDWAVARLHIKLWAPLVSQDERGRKTVLSPSPACQLADGANYSSSSFLWENSLLWHSSECEDAIDWWLLKGESVISLKRSRPRQDDYI